MVISRNRMGDMELPEIPGSNARNNERTIISPSQFTRKKLRGILHLITGELKSRGTKTPHIFLPFRSRIDDTKLELFISKIFPRGELVNMFDEGEVIEILRKFDEFTLICGLKYLWSRLPNNEIIGWDVYLEYKRKEKEAGYPKGAFLSIMPKCLSSPAHASIVYDFLDLLISIASNSQYNYLSGRKIAKMSSLWAFNGSTKPHQSPFYDATLDKENTFIDGLDFWKPSSEALFHLLLSFLRAMLPDNESDTLKLPKTLQSLLITNSYPPMENTDSIKSIITIPCVVVRSTKVSSNVYELLSKVRNTISFNKKDSFLSMENYTILKNIFLKSSTNEIVSSLTEESRRILSRLDADPVASDYDLYPGWARPDIKTDPDIPLFSQIIIEDISLQDYYIWTWLSSLASDQTSHNKKLFGRSIVVEASLKGFQKWLIITEQVLNSEEYIRHFRGTSKFNDRRILSTESYKNLPLPPPPPPKKDPIGLLPKYSFDKDDFKMEITSDNEDYIYPTEINDDELSDYRRYLDSLSDRQDSELASSFGQKTNLNNTEKKTSHRPLPPPFDSKEKNFSSQKYQEQSPQLHAHYDSNCQVYKPQLIDSKHIQNGGSMPIPGQTSLDANSLPNYKKLSTTSVMSSTPSQYLTPEGSRSPQKANFSSPHHSNISLDYMKDSRFEEPFENYETESERYAKSKTVRSDEPFDDYHVEGLNNERYEYKQIPKSQSGMSPELESHDTPIGSSIQNSPKHVEKAIQYSTENTRLPSNLQEPISQHVPIYKNVQNTDEYNFKKMPQVMRFDESPTEDYNELQHLQNHHTPTISEPENLPENVSEQLSDDGSKVKEEKKKKKHKKKKESSSPTKQDSEKFISPYGVLPPGPPPSIGTMPPMPFPPPPAGMIPPFFPPGPPPGVEEQPNESLDQKKKKDKARRKKKTEMQPQENTTIETNNKNAQQPAPVHNFDSSTANITQVNDYPDPNFQCGMDKQRIAKTDLSASLSKDPANNITTRGGTHTQALNLHESSQQHLQTPNGVNHHNTAPHITINDGQYPYQESRIRSLPQSQQYHPRPHHGNKATPNSPHSSRSVPHIVSPPIEYQGSHSAPHLPMSSEKLNIEHGQVFNTRTNLPYQNGPPNQHFYSPQGYLPQTAVQHHQTINHYGPPSNLQYYQTIPNHNNMGQYQAPHMNQQPYHPPVQNYYPPPSQMMTSPRMNTRPSANLASNNLPMMNIPTGVKNKKNGKTNKADLRAAFNQGTFGI